MRLYIEFIKNAFQVNITYRMNVLLRAFGSLLTVFIQVSVWAALFKGNNVVTEDVGVVTFEEMITYTLISTVISVIISNEIISRIEQKIITGEIATDFIKPMNFKFYLFAETIGNNIFRVIFELIPLLVVGIFAFSIQYPTWLQFVLFMITLANGIIIYLYLSYIFGLTAFWYIVTWHINAILHITITVMSGAIIPLWFFPKFLANIAKFLPFRLIYSFPISVYLGKIETVECISLIAQQLMWIGILWIVGRIVWSKATHKLIVQGG